MEDARGQPPQIPFWLGEAPGRTAEPSASVAGLREAIGRRLEEDPSGGSALEWLRAEADAEGSAASQIVTHLAAARSTLDVLPTQDTLVLERFFDETGGMQLVLHAPSAAA